MMHTFLGIVLYSSLPITQCMGTWGSVHPVCESLPNVADNIKRVYTDMLSSIGVEMDTASGNRFLQLVFLLFLSVTIHDFVACQSKLLPLSRNAAVLN